MALTLARVTLHSNFRNFPIHSKALTACNDATLPT